MLNEPYTKVCIIGKRNKRAILFIIINLHRGDRLQDRTPISIERNNDSDIRGEISMKTPTIAYSEEEEI